MKFCSHCGKELLDEAVICMGCGCAVNSINTGAQQPIYQQPNQPTQEPAQLLQVLSQRLNVNGIIWLVIGCLQILGGIFLDWFVLVIGILNLISAVQDIQYSKKVLVDQSGIVKKFEPLVGPIITLVYNLVIGGVIGVAGSVYYFIAIRKFVLENRMAFDSMDIHTDNPPVQ